MSDGPLELRSRAPARRAQPRVAPQAGQTPTAPSSAQDDPDAQLADAQFALAKPRLPQLARAQGARRALTVEGPFDAARAGDAGTLPRCSTRIRTAARARAPYGWTLLHVAAQSGRLAAVDLLLGAGWTEHAREGRQHLRDALGRRGGYLDVVRRLADAGGDVVGQRRRPRARGDRLGDVLARMRRRRAPRRRRLPREPRREAPHLLRHRDGPGGRGAPDRRGRSGAARPADESQREPPAAAALRRAHEPAARWWRCCSSWARIRSATDDGGLTGGGVRGDPEVDRAGRSRRSRGTARATCSPRSRSRRAARPRCSTGARRARRPGGALHLTAKRGDAAAVRWLLERGADPNARWGHWDAEVTPLHLAAARVTSRSCARCWTRAPIRASATRCTTATRPAGRSTGAALRERNGGRWRACWRSTRLGWIILSAPLCHPERSEGSRTCRRRVHARAGGNGKILRCAQDDRECAQDDTKAGARNDRKRRSGAEDVRSG